MDIRQLLLAAFEVEHREHIDAIRAALSGATDGRVPDWNDVFRRAHSLKGASRAVDLPQVEAVAHRLEALFERIVARADTPGREAVSAVHLALDRIEAYVAGLQDGAGPDMPGDVLAALDRCLVPASPSEPEPAAVATPVSPPRSDIGQDTGKPAPAAPPVPEPVVDAAQALLRIPAEAVEALTRATHELATALGGEAAVADGLDRLGRRAAALALTAERLRGLSARPGGDRIGPDAFDADLRGVEAGLLGLARDAADLSRMRASVASIVDGAAARVSGEAERLALVPAETVFGGFPRALRELAREAGREIDVSVRGLDLPVDRGMLQALKDAVLHALRNALSHGAESPEIRGRQGKPLALTIALEIAVRGGRLQVAVEDDGRGPDLSAIAETARRRGLLAAGIELEPEALLALVFEPGFSTAASVDTLSGRGIGLSVVADAVRRLGGTVRLAPRAPWGTVLAMDLPLSAARRALLLVEVGSAVYALPSAAAERLLRLDRSGLDTVMGRPVARIATADGQSVSVPVLDLRTLLGTPDGSRPEATGYLTAILLRAGGRRIVLAVDTLRDVSTYRVLPAPPIGGVSGLVSGTVILPGERPALVLDPEGLIARAAEIGGHALGSGPAAPTPTGAGGTIAGAPRSPQRTTILVVDDSITTRTLEKGILEAAGYRVVVCVDGQDALDRLRAGIEAVDLVVADVEMPRLDGFGLLKALRAEAAFARLPIILMTSRGDAEDVARGLDLGADAYLTKQKFDQRQLLDTIGQLL
ncbi:response regulator [Methylobacterium sp. BTF04]|uniref:hybrid sensor histidine kinase/response regulator n=1 Tax=Methylobacterium sp. BTF04 TaxID=2708300 RepID=UPI0013D35970|nr:response regulator [Methylobacterium sp. BTF04]NEU11173.1 response regulator [Methylobacterium sp. BTF04]